MSRRNIITDQMIIDKIVYDTQNNNIYKVEVTKSMVDMIISKYISVKKDELSKGNIVRELGLGDSNLVKRKVPNTSMIKSDNINEYTIKINTSIDSVYKSEMIDNLNDGSLDI